MFYITCMYICLAGLLFFCFVAEPREVGIDMKDDHLQVEDEKEEEEKQQSDNDYIPAG